MRFYGDRQRQRKNSIIIGYDESKLLYSRKEKADYIMFDYV